MGLRWWLHARTAMRYAPCPMIGFMIAVGKAVKSAMPKSGQLAPPEVVVQDRFA
jgi:hypothetical protein